MKHEEYTLQCECYKEFLKRYWSLSPAPILDAGGLDLTSNNQLRNMRAKRAGGQVGMTDIKIYYKG
jgi:hypothetical protein